MRGDLGAREFPNGAPQGFLLGGQLEITFTDLLPIEDTTAGDRTGHLSPAGRGASVSRALV